MYVTPLDLKWLNGNLMLFVFYYNKKGTKRQYMTLTIIQKAILKHFSKNKKR